ncbi:MAG: hypothetical protein RL328_702 [Acidobacteriota bacterium]
MAIDSQGTVYLLPASVTGTAFGSISLQAVSAAGKFAPTLDGEGNHDMGAFSANLGV